MSRVVRFGLFSAPAPVSTEALPEQLRAGILTAIEDADLARAAGDRKKATLKIGEAFAMHRALCRLERAATRAA